MVRRKKFKGNGLDRCGLELRVVVGMGKAWRGLEEKSGGKDRLRIADNGPARIGVARIRKERLRGERGGQDWSAMVRQGLARSGGKILRGTTRQALVRYGIEGSCGVGLGKERQGKRSEKKLGKECQGKAGYGSSWFGIELRGWAGSGEERAIQGGKFL